MTLPDERYRAVKYAADFLRDLIDPKKSPKVPKKYREQARRVLKHYPSEYDMYKVIAGGNIKHIFGEEGNKK